MIAAKTRADWKRAAAVLLAVGCALVAQRAEATPDYPFALDRALGVECDRPLSRCLICHTTALGGRTANQPFINTLRDLYGFDSGNDAAALREAVTSLQQLDTDADGVSDIDSDGDGDSDIDELMDCRNPSGPEYGAPEYGCDGAMLVPAEREPPRGWLLALVALVGLAAMRRRRAGIRSW